MVVVAACECGWGGMRKCSARAGTEKICGDRRRYCGLEIGLIYEGIGLCMEICIDLEIKMSMMYEMLCEVAVGGGV